MNALPVNYHLEVYEDSFMNDPVWHAEATNSFPALSIGDRFNHRGLGDVAWYTPPRVASASASRISNTSSGPSRVRTSVTS